jgi:hypothetical protein
MDVQNNGTTGVPGGVTGKGFMPGRSGNPGGRPKGLARRVAEFVGQDGERIAVFFFDVMTDPKHRMADRIDAARWLSDRGFGRVSAASDRQAPEVPIPVVVERKRTKERVEELLQIASELG